MYAIYADRPDKSIRLGPMDVHSLQETLSALRAGGWLKIIIHDVQTNAEIDEAELSPRIQ